MRFDGCCSNGSIQRLRNFRNANLLLGKPLHLVNLCCRPRTQFNSLLGHVGSFFVNRASSIPILFINTAVLRGTEIISSNLGAPLLGSVSLTTRQRCQVQKAEQASPAARGLFRAVQDLIYNCGLQ
jgi:hypothetical protein